MVMWWLLCLCCLQILLLAPCSLSEQFSLAGSPHPVVGVVGQDVVLPCQLSPPVWLPSMDLWWRKIGTGFIPVHEFSAKSNQNLPGESYQNRTELFLQELSNGNVSLKLKQLQVVDNGKYQCFVKNPEWSREATTELQVTAVAPVIIGVLGPQGQGIGLYCRSIGWFPKPELQWVGKNGWNLAMEIVTSVTQDRGNLYTIVSHIIVTEEDNGGISCIVKNGLLETEQQSAIHLSGDIFPHVSAWLAAFWVLFALDLIIAGACACLGYKAKQKCSKNKRSEEDTLFKREAERKNLEADCKDLRERLDRATTELDFRRARSYMIPVTLDPSYKHPELTMSADGRTVQHNPPSPEPAASSGALIAVGKEGFPIMRDHNGKAGVDRWYWEVDLGDSQTWELGVLSDTVRSKVGQNRLERPREGGFWVLGRSEGRYHPKEADDVIQKWTVKPTVIGVCLDLEWGHLSFYSLNLIGLIIEIPVQCSERLFPFLSPGFAVGREKGKPLSICAYSDWDFHQKLTDSQGNPTASAQSSAPNNGKGADYNTGPSATATTGSVPAQHPTPATQGVKANSSGSSGIKIFRDLFLKGHKGDKTNSNICKEKKERNIEPQSLKTHVPNPSAIAHHQGKANQKNTQNMNTEEIPGVDTLLPHTSGVGNLNTDTESRTSPQREREIMNAEVSSPENTKEN